MNNSDLPANPVSIDIDEYKRTINWPHNKPLTGLTKREVFAMTAMQGCCANSAGYNNNEWVNVIARDSVLLADALLKELDKWKH